MYVCNNIYIISIVSATITLFCCVSIIFTLTVSHKPQNYTLFLFLFFFLLYIAYIWATSIVCKNQCILLGVHRKIERENKVIYEYLVYVHNSYIYTLLYTYVIYTGSYIYSVLHLTNISIEMYLYIAENRFGSFFYLNFVFI